VRDRGTHETRHTMYWLVATAARQAGAALMSVSVKMTGRRTNVLSHDD
jgi:hypothetical protein